MSPLIRQERLDELERTIKILNESVNRKEREIGRLNTDLGSFKEEKESARLLRIGVRGEISKLHSRLGEIPLLRQKCDTKEKIIQDLIKKNQTLKKQNKKIINSKNRLQRELLKKYKENERGQKD